MTKQAPSSGRLLRNRQLVVLETPNQTAFIRLLIYKVTSSSRNRAHERRVEITSTYGRGLKRKPGYSDVVLGFDPIANVFVGLDPERLRHGGPTSNASSFLEEGGLRRSNEAPFVILLRRTRIFPEGELQAFFRPERIGEYLLNFSAVHSGAYQITGVDMLPRLPAAWRKQTIGTVARTAATGDRLVLERRAQPARRTLRLTKTALAEMEASKRRRRPRDLTPEELRAIQQRQEENGYLGEQFVYEYEKNALSTAGRKRLAGRVEWTSRRTVSAGYDIKSFDPMTGGVRYIEVKSCQTISNTFEVSANEWRSAEQYGNEYLIYRVTNVRTKPQVDIKLCNPPELVRSGVLRLEESAWRITIVRGRRQ